MHYPNFFINHIRRICCHYSICILHFLMQFLRRYRIIYFQISGLVILFIRYRVTAFIIIAGILFFLPLLFPKKALFYISFSEKTLHFIGKQIKNLLFTLLFLFIITPLALIKKIFSENKKSDLYIICSHISINFKKMWYGIYLRLNSTPYI